MDEQFVESVLVLRTTHPEYACLTGPAKWCC